MLRTVHDHLEERANRCLLIVYSDSLLTHVHLNIQDCCEKLINYGSIKCIQMTDDRRAALVDFQCEHAPLLVARCFALHQSSPGAFPMPRGVTTLLPGCSIGNYVYLDHVPRHLSNAALLRHFSEWNFGPGVSLLRPVLAGSLSSRVVVVLSGVPASRYTGDEIRLVQVFDRDTDCFFYSIPQLKQLSDYMHVCNKDGCDECNVVWWREAVWAEEERRRRVAVGCQNAQRQATSKRDGDDDSYGATRVPLFRDISDESERRRWGVLEQKQVSPSGLSPPAQIRTYSKKQLLELRYPVVIPEKIEPPVTVSGMISFEDALKSLRATAEDEKTECTSQSNESIPTTYREYLNLKANRCLLVLIGKDQLDERDCSDTLRDYGLIKKIELTSDRRAAFVEFDCHHVPILVARCYGMHQTTSRVRMPKGVAALLPGCSIDNFAHWLVPSALPTAALRDHLTYWSEGRDFVIYRPGTDANPSTHVVVEFTDGLADSSLSHNKMHVYEVRFNGLNYKFYAVPPIKELSNFSFVSGISRSCANCNITSFRIIVKDEELWRRVRWRAIQQEQIDLLTNLPTEMAGEEKSEEIGVEAGPISISKYISHQANRCLLIVIGKNQLGERDCDDTLNKYGAIRKIQLTSDLHAAFVEFYCEHAPLLIQRCFGYHQTNEDFPMPVGHSRLLPGCSIDNFLYLRVPSALPTVALREHLAEWCLSLSGEGCDFTIHRPGTDTNPSTHVVVEFNDRVAALSFYDPPYNKIHAREVNFNGIIHTFYAVPHIKQLVDDCISTAFRARDCDKCKFCKFLALGYAEEQARKAVKTESGDRQKQIDQWTSFSVEMEDEEKKVDEMVPLASLSSALEAPKSSRKAREPPPLKGILKRKEVPSVWLTQKPRPPPKSVRFDESTKFDRRHTTLTSPDFLPRDEKMKGNREIGETQEVAPPDPIQSPTKESQCQGVTATSPPFWSTRSQTPPLLSLSADEQQQLQQTEPLPALVTTHEIGSDMSILIVEESDRSVESGEDVVVEETIMTEEWKEEMDSSEPVNEVIEPGFNEDSVTDETQSSDDYESCNESLVSPDMESAEDLDLDDRLPGEEDKWTRVDPLTFSRLSPVPTVASSDTVEEKEKAYDDVDDYAPQLVMMEDDEEENEIMRDIIDRVDETSSAPSPTVSLVHEDTESSLGIAESSDDEYASDSSTVSYESTSTVVGGVDPEEWDEEDQIKYGYKRLPMITIEEDSQEEDTLTPLCSAQEKLVPEEKVEKEESNDGDEEEEKEESVLEKEEEKEESVDGDEEVEEDDKKEGSIHGEDEEKEESIDSKEEVEEEDKVPEEEERQDAIVVIDERTSEDLKEEMEIEEELDAEEEMKVEEKDGMEVKEKAEVDEEIEEKEELEMKDWTEVKEKLEEEQRELSTTACLSNRRSEVDSDDESTWEIEKRVVPSSASNDRLEKTTREHADEQMDMGALPSSVPIRRRRRRASVVDQEKDGDCPSTDSEYYSWLTREEPTERRESMDFISSSDSEDDTVPLPSSLSSPTWGKGIVIEETSTTDTELPEEEGPSSERVHESPPNKKTKAGRKNPTLGWSKKTTVSPTTVSHRVLPSFASAARRITVAEDTVPNK